MNYEFSQGLKKDNITYEVPHILYNFLLLQMFFIHKFCNFSYNLFSGTYYIRYQATLEFVCTQHNIFTILTFFTRQQCRTRISHVYVVYKLCVNIFIYIFDITMDNIQQMKPNQNQLLYQCYLNVILQNIKFNVKTLNKCHVKILNNKTE